MIEKILKEGKEEKKDQRINSREVILSIVASAGLISLALVAPNAVKLLKPFTKDKRRYQSTYYIEGVVKKLIDKKELKVEKEDGKRFVTLTKKGELALERFLEKENGREYERKKQGRRWDGKWRVIIFDIKEYKRKTRDAFRTDLQNFGFKKLQNSVWVYPYPCEDFVALLKANYFTGLEILMIEANKIENDGWLKRDFNLAH